MLKNMLGGPTARHYNVLDGWPGSCVRTAAPRPEGDQVPYRYQDDSTDQRPDDGDTIDIDITNTCQYNNLSQQPGTNDRSNDRTNDAKWETPANDGFCHYAHNGCN